MRAAYRYWCADCRYRTPRLPKDQGSDHLVGHYGDEHPGILPAGRSELVSTDLRAIRGCVLAVVGLVATLVVVAASCRTHAQPLRKPAEHRSGSAERAHEAGWGAWPALAHRQTAAAQTPDQRRSECC